MQRVPADGAELAVLVHGSGEPVVFIHDTRGIFLPLLGAGLPTPYRQRLLLCDSSLARTEVAVDRQDSIDVGAGWVVVRLWEGTHLYR